MEIAYDYDKGVEYTARGYEEPIGCQLRGEGLRLTKRASRSEKHERWLENVRGLDEKGNELLSEEKGGPMRKIYKTEDRQRSHDDKKAEQLKAVWGAALDNSDKDGFKWKRMVLFALSGRGRYDMTPMSHPPYDPNKDIYWKGEGPLRSLHPPLANPAFFLRFGVVVKRFRNWLDWVSKNCRGKPQCCSLTVSENQGVHQWYPSYWADRDLQESQWVWPPDYGGLRVFDWEHPSEEFPNEFDGIGNGYEPADSYGGWCKFSKEFEVPTWEQLRDGVNPDRARTRRRPAPISVHQDRGDAALQPPCLDMIGNSLTRLGHRGCEDDAPGTAPRSVRSLIHKWKPGLDGIWKTTTRASPLTNMKGLHMVRPPLE